jgi:Tat protein secretion system quality control protein TatD with DNase activity
MKLSLTLHGKTYSVESDESFDGSNVYDLAEQFKGLLVSAGFHPSNVDSIFDLDYQWFTDEENQGNMQGHLPIEDERMERLARDRKIQEFQDNMYKQDEDIFK